MKNANVNPKDVIFSLDIGTRTVIGTVGIMRDKKFTVICEEIIEHADRAMIDGQIHDIELVKDVVIEIKEKLESKLGFKLSKVAIAAAGRLLKTVEVKAELEVDKDKEITKELIKSLEMTSVKKGEDEIEETSGGRLYCVGYSVKSYYLNGYLITNLLGHKGEKISCEAIATFLPRSVVQSLYTVVEKAELEVMSLTLEPIAAMEAAVPKNLRLLNIALVDIGAGTSDIAICSKDSIVAYGMVPMAGDEVSEAIAQNYLIDFNTADRVKCELQNAESVTYMDIMGFENQVEKEEVEKLINPLVDKISGEVASKIIGLNGGKAPNAVFLVGGGAHTLGMRESLAQKLNLPMQRVGVKGREAVVECQDVDETLGSTGVTVLGIGLMAVKNSGHDFINITLNGEVLSLFNCYNHSIMDVLLQAGIDPMRLIGKKGKNIKFTFNGRQRVAFGSLPKEAEIRVNGSNANLDTIIKDGDEINLVFAENGCDASPKISDYIKTVNTITFSLDGDITNFEPIIMMDEKRVQLDDFISEAGVIEVIDESSLKNIRQVFNINDKIKSKKQEHVLEDDYIVSEGEELFICKEIHEETEEEVAAEIAVMDKKESNEAETNSEGLTVVVNEEEVKLPGDKKYMFVDIFNFIKFDLSVPKGVLRTKVNGNKAGYYQELKAGDKIEIFWE